MADAVGGGGICGAIGAAGAIGKPWHAAAISAPGGICGGPIIEPPTCAPGGITPGGEQNCGGGGPPSCPSW
eukprot:3523770-Prymnesium_polylepis.1